jgi:sugar lactone lactonase YvrE
VLLCLGACSRTPVRDATAGGDGTTDGGAVACARCDDRVFCNGLELCDAVTGACVLGEPEACDDRDECTIDSCDPQRDRCVQRRMPRDVDRDGFDACRGDCNDLDAAIHPGAVESCNAIDEDCDGRADEGLLSMCGDCRPGCRVLYLPEPGDVWHPTPDNSDAVVVEGASGPLVLSSDTRQRFDAWVANFVEGKVTKLDTRDGAQLARYDSVLRDGSNGAEPPDDECEPDAPHSRAGGNCPSRTAVDLQGAVYVANRAFERQGTLTKIAGFEDDCVDRNGDGEIQTSRDVNGNGQIDLHVDGEYLGQDDECLLWTVDVGGPGGVPRALAVAGDGSVWVGLHGGSRVLQLDPDNGEVIGDVAVPGFRPYGAAMDGKGRLWLVESLTGQILAVETASGTAGQALSAPSPEDGCPSSYGIAVDPEGRVWIAGFTCPYAFGYDPDARSWTSVALPDSGVTRGVAADDAGGIYVASSHEWLRVDPGATFNYFDASNPIARLTVFRADGGGDVRVFGSADAPLPGGGAIGVGLDSQSRAWLVNQDTGSATRVDVDSGEISHFGVGDLPYTYSDFTGFALRRITAPSGYIREVLGGCEQGRTEWEQLTVDADLPSHARVEIRLRTAATVEALADERWLGPWQEDRVDLLAPPGPLPERRFLEVEARLVSAERRSTPALRQITVRLHCPL